MAVESHRRAGVPRSGRDRRAPEGRHLGLGFATFYERTGYGTPAFAARGMEITPGYETVISPSTRPASSRPASAPRRTARACARRCANSSPTSSASRPT